MKRSRPRLRTVRITRTVSGTWAFMLATAWRLASWAASMRRWNARVSRNKNGVTTSSNTPRPMLRVKMTAMMPTTLQTSIAMLTMPSSKSARTVSTSLTKRELTAPPVWRVKYPAGRRSSLRAMALRKPCVTFWPATVTEADLRASIALDPATAPK